MAFRCALKMFEVPNYGLQSEAMLDETNSKLVVGKYSEGEFKKCCSGSR